MSVLIRSKYRGKNVLKMEGEHLPGEDSFENANSCDQSCVIFKYL